MFERRKISTGWFEATWNGKPTGFQIFNGSLGSTGYGPNMYGISTPEGEVVWVGSLASATASVKRIVERRAAAAGERAPAGC